MCTGTYLLFRPNDETMLDNRDYYQRQSSASDSDFTPRQVTTNYTTITTITTTITNAITSFALPPVMKQCLTTILSL